MLIIPLMTSGWLIVGAFIYLLIPGYNYPAGLLIAGCVTATDPILAQCVVTGKFAARVPARLKDLLVCESGVNDGMAFPFVYLSLYLLIYAGQAGKIIKDWLCVTILYEVILGSFIGICIGYFGRSCLKICFKNAFLQTADYISMCGFPIMLGVFCAGIGSVLGVDDLLVSFFAGCSFSWDGWYMKQVEIEHGVKSNLVPVLDLIMNMLYFIYYATTIPWAAFNDHNPIDVWRLILIGIVVIFLRRIPLVLLLSYVIPDIKNIKEALFVGHFGPIGVSGIFAAIVSKSELEKILFSQEKDFPMSQLLLSSANVDTGKYGHERNKLVMDTIWPIVCFIILVSMLVHGGSIPVIMLYKYAFCTEKTDDALSESNDALSESNDALSESNVTYSVVDNNGIKNC
ncbi:uncharacterized protein SCDLUD_000349 [Saccharomycodes ludwigii]|uniref:uncharacterized protein n=1 Tax=Saccharomycodes ludwigii TaxID=36035 RepID=UPI001E8C4608|nr:hypothetical protein SCDLUD_000349 [Saccharomycodes ludwigii]KAH3902760.1 hypothetical protein SCDLUD_000349 [Saccharomycodes ludwigii]